MLNVLIVIHDIDPNIYLTGLSNNEYKYTVAFRAPISLAMKKKFALAQYLFSEFKWVEFTKEEHFWEKIESLSREIHPDMIVSFEEDYIIPTEKLKYDLGIKNQYLNIKNIRDKRYQRKIINAVAPDLKTQFFSIQSVEDISRVPVDFPFPSILKPISLSGSRFTVEVSSREMLKRVFEEIMKKNLESSTYILEEKLLGSQWYPSNSEVEYGDYVSVESIVSDGSITHLAVCDKTPLVYPFRETGLILPSVLNQKDRSLIFECATRVIRALNYNNGPTHIEFKLTSKGPRLIEFNPRAGGPIPVQFEMGSEYNIMNNIIRSYFGQTISNDVHFQTAVACFYFQLNVTSPVTVTFINDQFDLSENRDIKDFFIFKHRGDIVDPETGVRSMLGFAYLKGPTSADCINKSKAILEKLNVSYS